MNLVFTADQSESTTPRSSSSTEAPTLIKPDLIYFCRSKESGHKSFLISKMQRLPFSQIILVHINSLLIAYGY